MSFQIVPLGMSSWIQAESREEELLRSGLELSVHLEGYAWEISGSSFVVLRNSSVENSEKTKCLIISSKGQANAK